MCLQRLGQGALERGAPVMRLVVDDTGRDPGFRSPLQPLDVGDVGDHDRDFCREGRVRRRVDQGLQVAAATGDQDTEFQTCQ